MSLLQKHSSRLIAATLAVATLAFCVWIWRLCSARSEVYFLEHHAPAEWILYPKPSQCLLLKDSEITAAFRRTFVLKDSPGAAQLSIRALTHWNVSLNGVPLSSSDAAKNWKRATQLDVSRQLHAGTNEILVTVSDTNGPPVLWLALEAGSTQIASGPDWDVSLMDAAWAKAVVAGSPIVFAAGSPLAAPETPLPSLVKHLLTLVIFAFFSAALVIRGGSWLKTYRDRGSLDSPRFAAIAIAVPVVLWAALFLNNHNLLPPRAGYDAVNHLEYIQYVRTFHKLPLATDGWQMYQPPLYYILSAILLSPFDPGPFTPGALEMLRFFGFCIGVAHFIIVFLCLRILFPGRIGLQWFGLLLAAFLPATLGLSQFATNECLAAMLFSAAVYFCLRILKEDSNSPKLFTAFGLCLGASLLTKFTGIIGLPFFAVALLGRPAFNARFPSRIRVPNILLAFAVTFVVCGWHYFRVWRHFGHPLVGNWDAAAGSRWWMEDGFHTRSWLFHFGSCLAYPWFSGVNGFADGLYSTFWGDGMWSGVVSLVDRPPWNYELMAAGYLLALLPTCLILAGGFIALRKFIRQPDPVWFLLLGVTFATLAALIFMCLKLPSYAQAKAFYGMIAIIPICAFGALTWELILRRGKIIFIAAAVLMGVWALTAYGAYWISSRDPEAHLTLGRYYADTANPAAAIQEYAAAFRLAPGNPKVRTRFAVQLARQNPAEMTRLLELNLKEFPDDAETHSVMSLLLASQNKFDPAIAEARKAVELAPDQPFAYPPLCKLLMAAGRFREAAEAGRAGLRVSPYDAALQRQTGLAFVRAGDPARAALHFSHAISLKPEWSEPRDDLKALQTNPAH